MFTNLRNFFNNLKEKILEEGIENEGQISKVNESEKPSRPRKYILEASEANIYEEETEYKGFLGIKVPEGYLESILEQKHQEKLKNRKIHKIERRNNKTKSENGDSNNKIYNLKRLESSQSL